jgi:hypothetical protein
MVSLLVFRLFFIINIGTADTVFMITGNVYNQMNYNFTIPSLAQLSINNKLTCAIQCAHYFANCLTAVFDASAIPQCFLYSETVVPAQLFVSTGTIVYDFHQNKLQSMKFIKNFLYIFLVEFSFSVINYLKIDFLPLLIVLTL